MERDKVIIKVSIQGITVNLILVIFKAMVGLMTNSIAIILDAVNNMSDALSQVITIVATKLSAKAPDKEHPYGYGRIEYISSVMIAVLILLAGITSLRESIDKAVRPEMAEYTITSLIIVAVAVVVKFVFGKYVKGMGEKVDSQSLIASGTDGFMDAILSFTTLVAAGISLVFRISLEGILGIVLSAFILKAGLEILKETLSSIIGGRADSELTVELKKRIRQIEGVRGAYDLILHDYGPSRSIGSVHIEVDDSLTAREIHHLTRTVRTEIYKEYGIVLTVGIYASNNSDPEIMEMKGKVGEILKKHESVLQFHGFYVDRPAKYILFDMVITFREKETKMLHDTVVREVEQVFPGYICDVNIDRDFSD